MDMPEFAPQVPSAGGAGDATATPGASQPATLQVGGPQIPVANPAASETQVPQGQTSEQPNEQSANLEALLSQLPENVNIFELPGPLGEKVRAYQSKKDREVAEARRQAMLQAQAEVERRLQQLEAEFAQRQAEFEQKMFEWRLQNARTPQEKFRIQQEYLEARDQQLREQQERMEAERQLAEWDMKYQREYGVPPHVLEQFDRIARMRARTPYERWEIKNQLVMNGLAAIARMRAQRGQQMPQMGQAAQMPQVNPNNFNQPGYQNSYQHTPNQPQTLQTPTQQGAPTVPVVRPAGSNPVSESPLDLFYNGDWDRLDEILS